MSGAPAEFCIQAECTQGLFKGLQGTIAHVGPAGKVLTIGWDWVGWGTYDSSVGCSGRELPQELAKVLP